MLKDKKIVDIEDLSDITKKLKENGKKIIHCHGVFDLLHIGHIRHFSEAKTHGDILIVTITPDHFVNKGPDRPVFAGQFRAEAIASLQSVDYVAINSWPTAIEAIKIIKPDYYVKGQDYKEAGKDRTGGIVLEDDAVRSVNGQLLFTNGITFSSSNIINQHLSMLSDEARDFLVKFKGQHDLAEIFQSIEDMKRLKVLVVGDAIIDEYCYCEAIGKSSKEPVIAVKKLSSEKFPGGILAIANHVASFAGEVDMLTFLGSENSEETYIRANINDKINARFLFRDGAPTITKKRYIEGYFFEKLFEVYDMDDGALAKNHNQELCDVLQNSVDQYDLVIVVDFGHGMMTREAIEIVCNKAKFLAVNTQANAGNWGYNTIAKYPKSDYVSLTEGEIRLDTHNRRGRLEDLMQDVSNRLNCQNVTVTRGKYGSLTYRHSEGFSIVPAFASKVVDRVGAGDALLSLTSLCAALNLPLDIMGFIGNVAGAQAVAMVGNRTPLDFMTLTRHIETLLK